MKKLFLVTRKSRIDYDEYDSCVLVADNVDEVNYLIDNKKQCYDLEGWHISYFDNGINDRDIEEIDLSSSKTRELCASFNAG